MSLLSDVLQVIREAAEGDLHLLSSHSRRSFPTRDHCDEFVIEPKGLDDDAYLDWCVEFAVANHVDLFVPSRHSELIADNALRFAERGVKLLLPGNGGMMRTLKHKGKTYTAIGQGACPIPEWRVVSDLAGLEAAVADLQSRHARVCFKPASGVYAHGFRVIDNESTAFDRLMNSGPYTASAAIGMYEVRLVLGNRYSFEAIMVLQYLEGRERSVDCIARGGKVVRCILRHKINDEDQVIENNAEVNGYVNEIVGRLKLEGVFNIQFRDAGGKPHLLEINSRMSGGLRKACLAADFALPYWAIKLTLGEVEPEDIPHPKTGATLRRVQSYEVLKPGGR